MGLDGPRQLATLPLREITARYGEAGLRERFALEIAGFRAADRQRIGRALDLAARLHAADRRLSADSWLPGAPGPRQREPYVNHLLRVTIRIISHYGVRDPDLACAALLHDAVEDHPGNLAPGGDQAGALAALAGQFGDRVAELTAAVTNPEPEPGRDHHEQYREHVAASLEASSWARVIKISDFTDNGIALSHATGPATGGLAGKYAPLVPILRELINRPDTPLSAEVKARITGQLDRAQHRFAAIQPAPTPPEADP